MKTTKRILSVLLAVLMALSLGVTAIASDGADDGWRYVPTSPDGLEDGDIWFDFTYLFDGATEEETAAGLAYYNAGDWYVNMEEHLVKCVSDNNLNGVYTRSQQPYILCIREVGVSWVDVHKNPAGIQAGDYYIDEAVFRSFCNEEFTELFVAQAIRSYQAEHEGASPTDEQISQAREAIAAQVEDTVVDMYWNEYTFSYNPHGTFYRYRFNMYPVPWAYYIVDYAIAQQMMVLVQALDASLRVADAAYVAASPWIKVASCIDDAEEGGYYIDFRDTDALMAAFQTAQTPSEEDIRMLESGEWYADLSRGVVTGKITQTSELPATAGIEGMDGDLSFWMPESEALYSLLKIKPVTASDDPTGDETPTEHTQPDDGSQNAGKSFMQRLADLFNKIVAFFRNLFRR